jgi:hypothetical protein
MGHPSKDIILTYLFYFIFFNYICIYLVAIPKWIWPLTFTLILVEPLKDNTNIILYNKPQLIFYNQAICT